MFLRLAAAILRCGYVRVLLERDNHRCFGRRHMMSGDVVLRRFADDGGRANQCDARRQHGDTHENSAPTSGRIVRPMFIG